MTLSIRQVKAARALLGWSQEVLSEKSGVPLSTIKRIEAADADGLPSSGNAEKIEKALIQGKKESVIFIPADSQGGAGVRLSK
jgi:ribosome-binding protein aMBF1 (putative translation factor)